MYKHGIEEQLCTYYNGIGFNVMTNKTKRQTASKGGCAHVFPRKLLQVNMAFKQHFHK